MMQITRKHIQAVITYILIIVFALSFLYVGNRIASDDLDILQNEFAPPTVEAQVIRVLYVAQADEMDWWEGTTIYFEARVTNGELRGEVLAVTQMIDDFWAGNVREVTRGDRILITSFMDDEWHFMEHVRFHTILLLGGIFIVLLLLFGRMKGLSTILSLGFTCVAVFAVFLPAILSGRNIYLAALLVCVYAALVTIFLVNGINRKSFAAVIGCLGGMAAAALLTFVTGAVLGLTGVVSGESMHLLHLPLEPAIDLRAIIFAGIIIGAVGAVMDVAVSIASALWELRENAPDLSFKSIFRSGINIGKDVMASMTNTLVLAYIGSSLSVILLLIIHAGSLTELLNRELVIVEFLKAMIGSLGLLFTMPLSALICAVLYVGKNGEKTENTETEIV